MYCSRDGELVEGVRCVRKESSEETALHKMDRQARVFIGCVVRATLSFSPNYEKWCCNVKGSTENSGRPQVHDLYRV